MRLIDANALKKTLCEEYEAREHYIGEIMLKAIDNAPTVKTYCYFCGQTEHGQIEERPQGEWIETNSNDENIICPFCKTEFNGDIKLICGGENPNFCPNCGAKMKGGVA